MRKIGLDALVDANRTANAPAQDARERNRRGLARRIAAGVVAVGAAAFGVPRGAATITGASAAVNSGSAAGAPALLARGLAKWGSCPPSSWWPGRA
jgi:hypothetical protein